MLSVRLRSGSAVPMIGLGTWTLRGLAARRVVRTALELGYRHLDTATAYANEADVGAALADSGVDRADVFVTTKLAARHADRPRATLEASLNALQVAWVDLWLIHAPPGGRARPDVWCALLEARDAGLARAVGVSNYPVALIEELIAVTGEAPAVNQIAWGPGAMTPRRCVRTVSSASSSRGTAH